MLFHREVLVINHAWVAGVFEGGVVVESREASNSVPNRRLSDPPIEPHDLGMVLLNDLGGSGKPVIDPGGGNEGKVISQGSALFWLQPSVCGTVESRIFGIINVGLNRAAVIEEEIMFHAMGRRAQM